RTPTFTVNAGKVFCRVRGAGMVYASVSSHVMIAGPLHGKLVADIPASVPFHWAYIDLTPYKGRRAHLEFTAAQGSDFAVACVLHDAAAAAIAEQKRLAAGIRRDSRLAMAMQDGDGVDEHVFKRGSYKTPGDDAPRRFLEALAGPAPLAVARGSGRLELARQM